MGAWFYRFVCFSLSHAQAKELRACLIDGLQWLCYYTSHFITHALQVPLPPVVRVCCCCCCYERKYWIQKSRWCDWSAYDNYRARRVPSSCSVLPLVLRPLMFDLFLDVRFCCFSFSLAGMVCGGGVDFDAFSTRLRFFVASFVCFRWVSGVISYM